MSHYTYIHTIFTCGHLASIGDLVSSKLDFQRVHLHPSSDTEYDEVMSYM